MKNVNTFYIPHILSIVYTFECNLHCRHCCFECSSQRKEKLLYEEVEKIVKDTSKIASIHTVSFSGGEIFIYFEEIEKLIKLCTALQFSTIITTNCFWGKDLKEAEKKMLKLRQAGLKQLVVSMDTFHQEHLDISCVKNVITLAKKMGINVNLNSVIVKSNLKNAEGLDRQYLDLTWERSRCLKLGRAKEFNEQEFIYSLNEGERCFSLAKEICVYPNGDIYPCCSPSIYKNENFLLGNIRNISIEEGVKNISQNKNIKYLLKYGFAKQIQERQIVTLCDICHDLKKIYF